MSCQSVFSPPFEKPTFIVSSCSCSLELAGRWKWFKKSNGLVERPLGNPPVNAFSTPAPPAAEFIVHWGKQECPQSDLVCGDHPWDICCFHSCLCQRWVEGKSSWCEGCTQSIKQTRYCLVNKGHSDAAWPPLFLFSLGRNGSHESKELATLACARCANFCFPNFLQLYGLLRQNLPLPF